MTTVALQTVFTRQPSLAFVFFIAFSLMVMLGSRFGMYAYWNKRSTDVASQAVLWEYLVFVGLSASVYGMLGAVEAATAVTDWTETVTTAYLDGVFLAFLLLLALTMREIYYNDALASADHDSNDEFSGRSVLEMGFTLLVTATVFAGGITGESTALNTVEGVGALVIVTYGLVFARRQLYRSSVRGTMIDSLLRHLLPVFTFGLLVLAFDLILLAGLRVEVIRHVQVVFVIMTATALMTATIKLRQNVEGI